MTLPANQYVLTTKGKLGKVVLPGYNNYEDRQFKPASVVLNTKVYQIWEENLVPISFVALNLMNDSSLIILKAETAFNLIRVLLRNRIKVKIDIEETHRANFIDPDTIAFTQFTERLMSKDLNQ